MLTSAEAFLVQSPGSNVGILPVDRDHFWVSERQGIENYNAMINPLQTVSLWGLQLGRPHLCGTQCLYPSCSLSFACSPPLHPSLHRGTSGSAFSHDNRQRFKLGERLSTRREETRKKTNKRRETERDREGDGWSEEKRHTDGHSPTDGELWGHLEDTWGSYEPIWFLLQEHPSVTNGKVGAGKHISVTARHCRKTN